MNFIYGVFKDLSLLSQIIVVIVIISIIAHPFRRIIRGEFENWILKRFMGSKNLDSRLILYDENSSYSYLKERIVNKKTSEELESDYLRIGYKKETIRALEMMVKTLSQK